MAQGTATKGKTGTQRTSKAPEERREDIIHAARTLYETRGIARTSIRDITEAVGVTRGLFYYYFPDKTAVTEAVIAEYTTDFVDGVHVWNESRRRGDVEGAARSSVKLLRRTLFDAALFKKNAGMVESSQLYTAFTDRVIREVVSCIESTTVEDYARYHHIEISYIYETFYVLIYGLVGLVKSQPDVDDDVLVAIIEQTLHLDVKDQPDATSLDGMSLS